MTQERPVLLGFRDATAPAPYDTTGHRRIEFFAGRNAGARGNCGDILIREDEWPTMRDALLRGGFDEMPSLHEGNAHAVA